MYIVKQKQFFIELYINIYVKFSWQHKMVEFNC